MNFWVVLKYSKFECFIFYLECFIYQFSFSLVQNSVTTSDNIFIKKWKTQYRFFLLDCFAFLRWKFSKQIWSFPFYKQFSYKDNSLRKRLYYSNVLCYNWNIYIIDAICYIIPTLVHSLFHDIETISIEINIVPN